MNWLMIAAVLSILGGCGLVSYYFIEKKKQKKEKNFIVIGSVLLLSFFFPGFALLVLGAIILSMIFL